MAEQVATNITWHEGEITPEMRASNMGQRGATLWLTGLSGSGKSTVAVELERMLLSRGKHAYRLDGDRTSASRPRTEPRTSDASEKSRSSSPTVA